MSELILRQPDDLHLHLRDGEQLRAVVGYTARQFARAIVMPNLKPPVCNLQQATAYHERILAALPPDSNFQPLMTLYLRDNTTVEEIVEARKSDIVFAAKLYPAGATTNSDSGVTDISGLETVFAAMADCGMPLLIHGEINDPALDIFDREAEFLTAVLSGIVKRHPRLKIVLEHISTAAAADFVRRAPDNVAATITAHHLLVSRNDMLAGGIKPHLYCLPILKRETDRQALLDAACSGNPKFFLGTDSAPHAQHRKESDCGCAGSFTAYAAMELYAHAFEERNALDKLEGFASVHGAQFYGLPLNEKRVRLRLREQVVPAFFQFSKNKLIPFWAKNKLRWTLES